MTNKYSLKNLLAIIFVISSVFSSTSIYNTSDFGIPLYYLSIVILAFYVLFDQKLELPVFAWVISGISISSILIISALQIFLIPSVNAQQITQPVFRIMPIIFFILLFNYVIRNRIDISYQFNFIMKIIIIYGIYQHFALMYNLPLNNNFFANNVSFNTIDLYNTNSGWNGTFRISAIWSEPAGSAVAITSFLAFMLFRNNSPIYEKVVWLFLTILFSYWTYSRILWLSGTIIIVLYFLSEFFSARLVINFVRRFRYLLLICLFVILILYLTVSPQFSDDLSTLSRSQSILVGWKVFFMHPFLGIGFGNFDKYEFVYSTLFSNYKTLNIILGVFSNYAATLGIVGLFIPIIPLYILLQGNDHNLFLGYALCCGLVTIGTIGSDIYTTSMVWLILIMWYTSGLKDKEMNI